MKRLLLHIGYPKTATTTLQEEFFVLLHKKKIINYLGRTTKSTHTRTGFSEFDGDDVVVELRRHYLFGKKLRDNRINLSDSMLNVISDEDLTFHPFLHELQFNHTVNSFELPKIISRLLGDDVQVELLLTIRNQADLIYSCFLQKYRFIFDRLGTITFNDFLIRNNAFNSNFFNLYNFDLILNAYEEVFNSKINILVFEDLKYCHDDYKASLLNIFDIDADTIDFSLVDKIYRERKKTNNTNLVRVARLSIIGRIVASFSKDKALYLLKLKAKHHMNFSILKRIEQRLLLVSDYVEVDKLTEKDKIKIMNFFKESNLYFFDKYGLDLEKMKKYNYVN